MSNFDIYVTFELLYKSLIDRLMSNIFMFYKTMQSFGNLWEALINYVKLDNFLILAI